MANIAGRIGMKVATIVVRIPVGIVTKKAVERTWATARPDNPPRKPSQPGVRWSDAIGWAALSSAGVVLADLLTRKGAREAWRLVLGTEPPQPKTSKAQKKLEGAHEDLNATT
ncbi:MAG: DUF4235 domain-containing protein [Actinomycetota bacterium]|nr:DUF4235 domain-containing protein [Actinomycetota bacterium]